MKEQSKNNKEADTITAATIIAAAVQMYLEQEIDDHKTRVMNTWKQPSWSTHKKHISHRRLSWKTVI